MNHMRSRGWSQRVLAVGAAGCLLGSVPGVVAETPLQKQIQAIAVEARGTVGVACALPGTKLDCDLDAREHPPMQSVFKLPLGMTVLHLIEQGKFSLDQEIRFLPEDRILPHVYSPLQEKYPEGGVDVPVRELLRLSVSLSDNVAADILLRVVGGPAAVQQYVDSLGVSGFHLEDGEKALHAEMRAQYRNWFEPAGAVELLRRIADRSPISPEHTALLLGWMRTTRTTRIGSELPAGTVVEHKTGTSDVENGVAYATNDIGLITLPDGRKLAVAVFVTDSKADDATRTRVIGRVARAAYEAAVRAGR